MAIEDSFMKKPPVFREGACYATFVTRTKYWCSITTIPKEKQAIVLALNLPADGSCNNLSERLFSQLGDEGLQGEAGLVNFWNYMDKEYKKDPMGDMCESIRKFTNYKRRGDQSIQDYVNEFETLYNKANVKGMGSLPQPYLMFLMFENSLMDEKDQRLVMVEVDFNQKESLLQQTKDGLIKLFGGIKPIKERSDQLKLIGDNATFYQNYQARSSRPSLNSFRGYSRPQGPPRQFNSYATRQRFIPPQHRISGTPSGGGSRPKLTASKLNPVQFGQTMQCYHCGAQTHLVKACPELNGWTFVNYQYENQEDPRNSSQLNYDQQAAENPCIEAYPQDPPLEQQFQEVNLNTETYVTDQVSEAANYLGNSRTYTENENFYNTFDILTAYENKPPNIAMDQALRKIIVDTGCIETVCGKAWLNDILDTMDDCTRKLVRVYPSNKIFRFGGGERKISLGEYVIPIAIGGKNIMLRTNTVDSYIPCLLSKSSMIAADMKILVKENAVKMFNDTYVKMETIPSGHSVLVVEPFNHGRETEFYALVTLPEVSKTEEMNEKRLFHIHEQLGHPGQNKMEIMLREAGLLTDNVKSFLNKIYKVCATCFIHARSKPRPKVAPPMAHDLNETVCMDLKIWPKYNVKILYIIDVFTRYTQAYIVPDKSADAIIKPFLNSWILNLFGAPKNVIFDNGPEFMNSKMRDLCKNFNIRMFTTAAYSPYQNGLCERNHHLVDEIIEKMMSSGNYSKVKDALQPAIFAKNILVNSTGYSPYQTVYGKNPRIPGAIDNSLPAQEGMTTSALIQKRISSIFDARKALAQAENKARPKLAEKVVAQDNKLVFVRHGRNIIVCSLAKISKVYPNYGPSPAKATDEIFHDNIEKDISISKHY